LLNIKRVAYETRSVTGPSLRGATGAHGSQSAQDAVRYPGASASRAPSGSAVGTGAPDLPQAPSKPVPEPISSESLTRRIDAFLSARGIRDEPAGRSEPANQTGPAAPSAPSAPPAPAEFVSEADVRNAVKLGQKIVVGEKTIITPAARDAGDAAKVFTWQTWPS
jgi:hypothetical protein